jgi:hypothetical protein
MTILLSCACGLFIFAIAAIDAIADSSGGSDSARPRRSARSGRIQSTN